MVSSMRTLNMTEIAYGQAHCTDESDVIRSVTSGSAEDCFAVGTELSVKEINSH